jgi:hypothetical protein
MVPKIKYVFRPFLKFLWQIVMCKTLTILCNKFFRKEKGTYSILERQLFEKLLRILEVTVWLAAVLKTEQTFSYSNSPFADEI